MARPKRKAHIEPLTAEQARQLTTQVDAIALRFRGQFDQLESALGMLLLGRLFGWKVLALIHNKRTIRSYEQVLGISIRDEFPEEGPLAFKSLSFSTVKELGEFWKAVSGDLKVENRRTLAQ